MSDLVEQNGEEFLLAPSPLPTNFKEKTFLDIPGYVFYNQNTRKPIQIYSRIIYAWSQINCPYAKFTPTSADFAASQLYDEYRTISINDLKRALLSATSGKLSIEPDSLKFLTPPLVIDIVEQYLQIKDQEIVEMHRKNSDENKRRIEHANNVIAYLLENNILAKSEDETVEHPKYSDRVTKFIGYVYNSCLRLPTEKEKSFLDKLILLNNKLSDEEKNELQNRLSDLAFHDKKHIYHEFIRAITK